MLGFILKKDQEKTISEIVHDLMLAVQRAGLEHSSGYESKMNEDVVYVFYVWQYLSSGELPGEHRMKITVCSTGQNLDEYDWVIQGGTLFEAAMFQDVDGREKMVLDILYEYFKLNPDDYFVDYASFLGEVKWYYTAEDIRRIRLREFDPSWCYKPPCPEEDMKRKKISGDVRLVSGSILKKAKEKTIYEIINDIELAAQRAGLQCRMEPELFENVNANLLAIGHLTGYVSGEEMPAGEQLLMQIRFTNESELISFDWLKEGGKLFRAIAFHCISGREKMLLDFLYEYFRLNPQDYFVDSFTLHLGDRWYYTPEAIAKIKEREYDPSWWYIKPQGAELWRETTDESDDGGRIPAFIIKREGEKNVDELLRDIRVSAERAGFDYQLDAECNAGAQGALSDSDATCTIEGETDDPFEISVRRKLKLHIRSMEKDDTQYEWIKSSGKLIRAVTFDGVEDREEMLLYFLYEYLQRNPEDYFVVGNIVSEDAKWYYTFKEVTELKQYIEKNDYYGEGFDYQNLWCYKNPLIKRKYWDTMYGDAPLPIEFE